MRIATTDARPLSPGMRAILYVAAGLVFCVGVTLFLLTEQTERYFAWTIQSALTAAFLGASYWASCVLEFSAARQRHWAYARVAVPAVIIFTTLTLVVTLLHIGRFHFGAPELITRVGTWFWLAVYVTVPVVMTALLVRQLREPGGDPPRAAPTPGLLRAVQAVIGGSLLLIGLALFLAPEATLTLWPWALTPLTARAIGAWLIGLGITGVHAAREGDLLRARPVLVSMIVFCALQFVALARYPSELAWGSPAAAIFLAYLAALLLIGLYGVLATRGRTDRPVAAGGPA